MASTAAGRQPGIAALWLLRCCSARVGQRSPQQLRAGSLDAGKTRQGLPARSQREFSFSNDVGRYERGPAQLGPNTSSCSACWPWDGPVAAELVGSRPPPSDARLGLGQGATLKVWPHASPRAQPGARSSAHAWHAVPALTRQQRPDQSRPQPGHRCSLAPTAPIAQHPPALPHCHLPGAADLLAGGGSRGAASCGCRRARLWQHRSLAGQPSRNSGQVM